MKKNKKLILITLSGTAGVASVIGFAGTKTIVNAADEIVETKIEVSDSVSDVQIDRGDETDTIVPVDPTLVAPGIVDPGIVDPGTVDPGTVDPGVVDPGTVDPGVVDPGIVDPGPVNPGIVDSGTVDTEKASPENGLVGITNSIKSVTQETLINQTSAEQQAETETAKADSHLLPKTNGENTPNNFLVTISSISLFVCGLLLKKFLNMKGEKSHA